MENKFKEFWIDFDESDFFYDCKVYDKYPGTPSTIHVVEYAALQACEARLLAYEKQIAESRVSLESANAEKTELKEALKGATLVVTKYHTDNDFLRHELDRLESENKKLSDDNDKLKQLFSVQLDVMEQNKNLESKLLEAVKIINEMQGAIKYGGDNGWEALNIGAKFNSNNPDLFNKYLKDKGIL